MAELMLEMRNITKTFPGVRALDRVYFNCFQGEVHALVGENGAGKSTLMKILAGVLQPDHGEIFLKGRKVQLFTPADAQRHGISIIYQEFNLLPWLNVAENILLGRLPRTRLGLVDWKQVYREAQQAIDRMGVELDLRRRVVDLNVPQQQIVEIARALSLNSDVIIMDEPSAVLAGHELERLFEVIRTLKNQGVTVIYISHRLGEVFEIADRATVLKDGQVMGTVNVREASRAMLVRMMVGRTLDETFPIPDSCSSEPVLKVQNIVSSSAGLHNISFTLHRGEILGLAGLVGSGRTRLARALFGVEPIDAGEVWLDGRQVTMTGPKKAIRLGISLVPEDRKGQGLVLQLPVRHNITLAVLDRLTRIWFLNEKEERKMVTTAIQNLDIKTPRLDQEVQYLSGGNQQKVVLAKWLSTHPKVIILDEPTRGIDVRAKVEIYHLIRELARRGTGIILISSELPEIIGMSHRILVMCRGRIAGQFSREEASEEKILTLAVGESLHPASEKSSGPRGTELRRPAWPASNSQ